MIILVEESLRREAFPLVLLSADFVRQIG